MEPLKRQKFDDIRWCNVNMGLKKVSKILLDLNFNNDRQNRRKKIPTFLKTSQKFEFSIQTTNFCQLYFKTFTSQNNDFQAWSRSLLQVLIRNRFLLVNFDINDQFFFYVTFSVSNKLNIQSQLRRLSNCTSIQNSNGKTDRCGERWRKALVKKFVTKTPSFLIFYVHSSHITFSLICKPHCSVMLSGFSHFAPLASRRFPCKAQLMTQFVHAKREQTLSRTMHPFACKTNQKTNDS